MKIKSISTKYELDEFEQNNIEKAVQWTLAKKFKPDTILTEQFTKTLHKKMFADVWSWAGTFRLTNKNLGVDKTSIATQLKILMDDASYWLKNSTFKPEEFAIRVKHRLVSIHPFPNGNGRHSRLFADILISHIFDKPVFSWGRISKIDSRKRYIQALKAADLDDYDLLLEFARS